MNSIIGRSGLAAVALCGIWLAGCDSVKDVRDEPHTAIPPNRVALGGKIFGLGIRRSIGLQNGPGDDAPFLNFGGVIGERIDPVKGRETLFSFGALNDGDTYDIRVKSGLTPFGKVCEVHNGTGVLHYNENAPGKGAPQNIEVRCVDDPNVERHDIRVTFADSFRDAPGAKVRLMTEESVYEQDPKNPADGGPNHLWFRDALIVLPAGGVLPFQNIVTATTEEGSTPSLRIVNRCAVANHTWSSPIVGTPEAADVTDVSVEACQFSVGGNDTVLVNGVNPAAGGAVRYSLPFGVTTVPPMGAGGVTLELRYPNGDPIPSPTGPTTEVTITSFGSQFTFPTLVTSGAECSVEPGVTATACEVRGFYEVVVKQHPAGQRCIVGSSTAGHEGPLVGLTSLDNPRNNATDGNKNFGGAANLYVLDQSVTTATFPRNPVNYTGLRVFCRNHPAANRQLTGTYQVTNQAIFSNLANGTVSGILPWSPSRAGRREYSHMLTFFADGTFVFGAHTASDAVNTLNMTNHAEQGFYDYDPNNVGGGTATVTGPKLRFTIHVDGFFSTATSNALAGGLSAAEGPRTVGTGAAALQHRVMTNVQFGTDASTGRRALTGTFGPDGSPATAAGRIMSLVEAYSLDGEMTGSWFTQDSLRFWSYNFENSFGFHAGVTGFPNVQDNCFRIDAFSAPSGQIVSSPGGGATYCSPVGSTVQNNVSSLAHSPPPLLQFRLPGWRGWIPGGELGGGSLARSPSPVHYQVASPGTFLSVADPVLFPPGSLASTDWCTTEILGMRPTQNGELVPDRKPIYFCRSKAN